MEEKKSLTEGSILKALLGFAVPVLFALFLQAMYGAVDLLVVGRFGETADVSGVATGSMLMHTVTMVVTGLAMGITILVGQAIGKGESEESSRAIGSGICLFAVCGVILTVLVAAGADFFTELMQAPEEAFYQTAQYLRICGAGFIFIIAYNVLGAVFRGLGDSRTPLFTVAVACAVNIGGDLLFVAIFHWGAAGAAVATVLAQAVSVMISLCIIRKKKLPFTLKKGDIRFDPGMIRRILILGTPVALQDLLVGISFLVVQAIVNSKGMIQSAGVGVAEKVCHFLMLVAVAYMQSMSAFVAQNIGAGKHRRARKALLYGIASAFVIGIVMFYISFFHGDVLAGIFDEDPAVVLAAHSYLKAYAIDCLLTAILFCFIGYYNGCERTFFVMMQGLIGAFGVRVPVVYLVSRWEESTLFHIGLATPASSAVQIALCLLLFFHILRKERRERPKLCQ